MALHPRHYDHFSAISESGVQSQGQLGSQQIRALARLRVTILLLAKGGHQGTKWACRRPYQRRREISRWPDTIMALLYAVADLSLTESVGYMRKTGKKGDFWANDC